MTISLVTYNGLRWLDGCLSSLAAQTMSDLEIVILDNGSTDGSPEYLRAYVAEHPEIRLILQAENGGYAGGHNRVIAATSRDFICLLNQDVILDPRFLEEALAEFSASPQVGAVQGRVWRMTPDGQRTDVLDTTGLEIHRSRRVVSRGAGRFESPTLQERADQREPVFGADGPCPVYRRAALEDVAVHGPWRSHGRKEYLDEDFFAYKEDVDLAWRLRSAGWETRYLPNAMAWHGRTAAEPDTAGFRRYVRHRRSMAPWLRQRSWRNHRLMMIKNERPRLFLRDFGPIVWREVRSLVFIVVVHPRDLGALPSLVRLIPRMVRKRRELKRTHRLSDQALSAWFR